MKKLTKRQAEVLVGIQRLINKGICPTTRKIAALVGSKIPMAGLNHMKALVKKGYLKVEGKNKTGMTVLNHIVTMPTQGNELLVMGTKLEFVYTTKRWDDKEVRVS